MWAVRESQASGGARRPSGGNGGPEGRTMSRLCARVVDGAAVSATIVRIATTTAGGAVTCFSGGASPDLLYDEISVDALDVCSSRWWTRVSAGTRSSDTTTASAIERAFTNIWCEKTKVLYSRPSDQPQR